MSIEEIYSMIRKLGGVEPSIFENFYQEILAAPLNLTAITARGDFFLKHILDSIYIFNLRQIEFKRMVDIGSGGGFPGIPIAAVYPEREIYLVESISKKCRFLESCALKLSLRNLHILNCRAEHIDKYNDSVFDLITSRGVGSVRDILHATLHIAAKNTVWLMYKGERAEQEVAQASDIMKKRGIKSEIIRIEEPITRTYLFLRYS
ncbi:MAG: 16S rRNA (guanine(527)-N(7))-methyltransferase RsmG [Deferribacteraceae bacterium]|jgi:16S rRNA (guanine527-N7)-methyltransferase|nr:16S rRNA (guanine(527)-N(7))-methyltransferase RsmG [Deferribacteraceae bacterium]